MNSLLEQFQTLRAPVRALVFLFWVYSLTTSLTSVFIQLFLFQQFSSFALNVLATVIFDTGVAVSFCVLGFAASRRRINIKHGFLWSFILMGATLVALLESKTPALAYLAMGINGLGNGLFWLTIHTYELSETRDEERDFYSSLLSAGTVIVSVIGPALATLLLWLSGNILHWGDFTLLFIITPLFYFFGFFSFGSLRDYRPEPVEWRDLVHFLSERKNRAAQPYLLSSAGQEVASTVVFPLVILFFLGSVVQVGIFATLFAAFSCVCVLALSRYRNTGNRLRILGLSALPLALLTLELGAIMTPPALIAYGFVAAVFWPVVRVSLHVTDLYTMESMAREGKDFYATMLLRDASLWLWRVCAGAILVGLTFFFASYQDVLAGGLAVYAFFLVSVFGGATLLYRAMHHS